MAKRLGLDVPAPDVPAPDVPALPCTSQAALQWYPDVQTSAALRDRLALPSVVTESNLHLAARSRRQTDSERVKQAREASIENNVICLQLRLTLQQWRVARRTIARQGLLLRQLAAQRNDELGAAAVQSEKLLRLEAQHHELTAERKAWTRQSAEHADVIAAAIAAAARTHDEHEEEVCPTL